MGNRRFAERQSRLFDLVNRFEARSSSDHAYDAIASIDFLRDQGAAIWEEGSRKLVRWRRACGELRRFLNGELGVRRFEKKEELAATLREFIQEFEHSTGRMYQLLHEGPNDATKEQRIEDYCRWVDLAFRFAIYAIVSSWIDDKREERRGRTKGCVKREATYLSADQ